MYKDPHRGRWIILIERVRAVAHKREEPRVSIRHVRAYVHAKVVGVATVTGISCASTVGATAVSVAVRVATLNFATSVAQVVCVAAGLCRAHSFFWCVGVSGCAYSCVCVYGFMRVC
jgi:hypothetical protein